MKLRSSEILKNEFLFFNDQKQLGNKLKKETDKDEYHKSKLDYFPFVSGEMLEQHRKGLTGQMRADLQNYLIAKSQGTVGQYSSNRTQGRYGSGTKSMSTTHTVIAPTLDGQIDIRSDRLTKNTPVHAAQVKALHDSCYVEPERNPRVI